MKNFLLLLLSTLTLATTIKPMEVVTVPQWLQETNETLTPASQKINLALWYKEQNNIGAAKQELRSVLAMPEAERFEKASAYSLLGGINFQELKEAYKNDLDDKTKKHKTKKVLEDFQNVLTLSQNDLGKAFAQFNLTKIALLTKQEYKASLQLLAEFAIKNPVYNQDSHTLLLNFAKLSTKIKTPLTENARTQILKKLQDLLLLPNLDHLYWLQTFKQCFELVEQAHPAATTIENLKLTGVDLKSISTDLSISICEYYNNLPGKKKDNNLCLSVLNAYRHYKLNSFEPVEYAAELFNSLRTMHPKNYEFAFYYVKACLKLIEQRDRDIQKEETKQEVQTLQSILTEIAQHSSDSLKWKARLINASLMRLLQDSCCINEFKTIVNSCPKTSLKVKEQDTRDKEKDGILQRGQLCEDEMLLVNSEIMNKVKHTKKQMGMN